MTNDELIELTKSNVDYHRWALTVHNSQKQKDRHAASLEYHEAILRAALAYNTEPTKDQEEVKR